MPSRTKLKARVRIGNQTSVPTERGRGNLGEGSCCQAQCSEEQGHSAVRRIACRVERTGSAEGQRTAVDFREAATPSIRQRIGRISEAANLSDAPVDGDLPHSPLLPIIEPTSNP